MSGHDTWVGVDLDETLAFYDGWKGIEHIGEPIPKMVAFVRNLLDNGVKVKIFTARCQEGPKAIEYIVQWCLEHIGVALPVTDRKDFGLLFIVDDRALAVKGNTGEFKHELPDIVFYNNWHWNPENPRSPTYKG